MPRPPPLLVRHRHQRGQAGTHFAVRRHELRTRLITHWNEKGEQRRQRESVCRNAEQEETLVEQEPKPFEDRVMPVSSYPPIRAGSASMVESMISWSGLKRIGVPGIGESELLECYLGRNSSGRVCAGDCYCYFSRTFGQKLN